MHFRCPECGQAHEMLFPVNNNAELVILTQSQTMSEVYVNVAFGDNLSRIPEDHPDYETIAKQINAYVIEYDDSGRRIKKNIPDTKVRCRKCEKESPIKNWFEAFDEPLKYFETENMCHCGGELWMDKLPGSNRFVWSCDDCGWVKPNAVVSGGEQMI